MYYAADTTIYEGLVRRDAEIFVLEFGRISLAPGQDERTKVAGNTARLGCMHPTVQ
jgi:hypothetical protein